MAQIELFLIPLSLLIGKYLQYLTPKEVKDGKKYIHYLSLTLILAMILFAPNLNQRMIIVLTFIPILEIGTLALGAAAALGTNFTLYSLMILYFITKGSLTKKTKKLIIPIILFILSSQILSTLL